MPNTGESEKHRNATNLGRLMHSTFRLHKDKANLGRLNHSTLRQQNKRCSTPCGTGAPSTVASALLWEPPGRRKNRQNQNATHTHTHTHIYIYIYIHGHKLLMDIHSCIHSCTSNLMSRHWYVQCERHDRHERHTCSAWTWQGTVHLHMRFVFVQPLASQGLHCADVKCFRRLRGIQEATGCQLG